MERAHYFIREKTPWILKTQEKMRERFANKIALQQSRKEYKELKQAALTFIKNRITHYNQHYKFSFNKISIRMQASRWGSCSAKKNLNFNYSLIKIPLHLADYIVVHELCHLKEMNHGQRFWALVAETIPQYKAWRKELGKWVKID